jgi:hypothetical protein
MNRYAWSKLLKINVSKEGYNTEASKGKLTRTSGAGKQGIDTWTFLPEHFIILKSMVEGGTFAQT